MPAAVRKPSYRPSQRNTIAPSKPLSTANRENFCQLVANMVPVPEAYRQAGYSGTDQARSQLRRSLDVDERIKWLLADRVNASTRARLGREKKIEDSRLRLLREVERLATSNIAELVAWDRKPVLAADGTVEGFADEIITTPSKHLSRATLATVKSVTTKAGALKLELHGKENPLALWAKILGVGLEQPMTVNVDARTVNLGQQNALEIARRLAFIMGNAVSSPLIEGEVAKPSEPSE